MHALKLSVTSAAAAIELPDPDGGWVWVRNDGAVDIFIGGADVDASGAHGYPVKATGGQVGPVSVSAGEQVYAISSGATNALVSVLQSGEIPK